METLNTTVTQGAAGMHPYDTTVEQGAADMHPYTALLAEQAGLIDVPLLVEALTWLGVSTPEGREVAAARVGHLTNYLIQRVLQGKDEHRQRAEAARAQHGAGLPDHYSPAEQRAFNAGRAFAERIARVEQNARRRDLCQTALDGLGDDFGPWAALQEIVKMLYPDIADLADQDPALARRALDTLQPD